MFKHHQYFTEVNNLDICWTAAKCPQEPGLVWMWRLRENEWEFFKTTSFFPSCSKNTLRLQDWILLTGLLKTGHGKPSSYLVFGYQDLKSAVLNNLPAGTNCCRCCCGSTAGPLHRTFRKALSFQRIVFVSALLFSTCAGMRHWRRQGFPGVWCITVDRRYVRADKLRRREAGGPRQQRQQVRPPQHHGSALPLLAAHWVDLSGPAGVMRTFWPWLISKLDGFQVSQVRQLQSTSRAHIEVNLRGRAVG